MELYLRATRFCDIHHPVITDLARQFDGESTTKGKAIAIFRWVRDEVAYRFDYWNVKASETAIKRMGMCANKANLQIALLRSLGIPAGYHVLKIRKEILKPVSEPCLYEQTRSPTIHVFCSVYLDGRWLSADATVDRRLFLTAYSDHDGWEYRDWDGDSDSEMNPKFVVEDLGISPNIDMYLSIPPRFLNDSILLEANRYLDNLLGGSGSESRPE